MKPKQRKKLRERKALKTLTNPSTCAHYEVYMCSRCMLCYVCMHTLIEREEAGAIFWYRCPDGFEKPAYLDAGQFASLRKAHPDQKGIPWEKF